MRCVILKNCGRVPVTLQLNAATSGKLPHIRNIEIQRFIVEVDPSSGQERVRDKKVSAPASVTIQAGGSSPELPYEVLAIPQVKALINTFKTLKVAVEKEV